MVIFLSICRSIVRTLMDFLRINNKGATQKLIENKSSTFFSLFVD